MNLKYFALIYFFIFQFNILGQSGFKGGVALSSYYTSENSSFRNINTGPDIGYFSDWNIKKDSLKSYYFSYGFESNFLIKSAYVKNISEISDSYPLTYDYVSFRAWSYSLEVPFIFKLHYNFLKETQLQVSAGYSSTINFGATYSNRYFPLFFSFDYFAGIGISYKEVILDLRYTRGLTDISPNAYFQTLSICMGYALFN